MNILETFFVLFRSDNEDLEQGAAKAKKTTDELDKHIKSTDKDAKLLGTSFRDVAAAAAGAITSIAAFATLGGRITEAAALNNELYKQANILGIDAGKLSAWGSAVQAAGGSSKEFMGTLRSIYEHYSQIGLGGRVPQILDILPRLADRFAGMSKSMSFAYGKRLGLDEGTIMLLQRGRKEVEAILQRQQQLAFVTTRDTEVARKFNMEWDNTRTVFQSLFTTIGTAILPAFSWLFEKVQDIIIAVREHKGFLLGFFAALGAAIGALALSSGAFLAPWLAMAGIILAVAGAFGLLFDDINIFMEGGDSLISRAIKRWPMLGEILKGIGIDIKQVGDNIQGAFNIDTILEKWKTLHGYLKDFMEWSGRNTNAVRRFFGMEEIKSDSEQQSANPRASVDFLREAKAQIELASGNPITAQTSNSVISSVLNGNREMNINIDNIMIETQANDPQGIALGIKGELDSAYRSAVGNWNSGVIR